MWEMFLGYSMDEWIALSKAMARLNFTPVSLTRFLDSLDSEPQKELSFDEWNW